MKQMHRGPLSGIRVLDLGQYIAGPAVAMMLADHGAEVVRVDSPGGPHWQSPANAVLNRGKARITLDLRKQADLSVLRQLAASADVFIENARPGVMRRLGLGADKLTSLNPRLIYLSLPGLSSRYQNAPDVRAWEGVLATMGGMYSDMSVHRQLYGSVPSYNALPMPSANAAVLGTLGVLTALFNRQRSGRGEIVEVPLLAALHECTPFNTMRVHGMPNRYLSDAEHELERRKAGGEPCTMSFAEVDELRESLLRTLHLQRRTAVLRLLCRPPGTYRTPAQRAGPLGPARRRGPAARRPVHQQPRVGP